MVEVRSSDGRVVTRYNGYKYFSVEDKDGNFLFGFHISADSPDADVYFCSADVSFDADKDRITVRSQT